MTQLKRSFFSVVFLIWPLIVIPTRSLAQTISPQEVSDLKVKLNSEVKKGSCLSTLPLARSIYSKEPEYLPALKTIADCTQSEQNIGRYATETKELFEQSKILSIVPKLLDMAQVKDLVPILREVEVKKDKSISEYLMLNEIYERLGDPEKQINTLKDAIKSSPTDPRPLLLLASKQFESGFRDEAQGLFRTYLEKAADHPGRLYLMAYVLALAYPLSVSLAVVALIWALGAILTYRKIRAFSDWHEFHFGMPLLILFLPPLLAFRFWQSGKALPIGALLLVIVIQLFLLFKPLLSIIYTPILKFFGKIFYFVLNGTLLAKKLESMSTGTRVLISFTTLVILGTITPTIDIPDLKYAVIIFCSLVLYATIGSLMVSFMHSRQSLSISLRWIGIAATLPYLISYVVANWSGLGTPLLYGQLPAPKVIDSLASYLLFWGVSLFLALHLGKIIAQAFTQPLTEMVEKVTQIEKGQFDMKVRVFSRDEIGRLADAINRMGSGLARREKIEKTFRKYVDHQIADRILDGLETEVRVDGQNVNAVVMFADIRGFTSFSEKTHPQEIVRLLNQFFERMVKIVRQHGGVIDKFIGDNLMAVWGVPKAIEKAESKAVSAALEMLGEVQQWNQELMALGYPEIGVGIGINCGWLVAGSIGSSDRMEYTVIGDTVNTAQRCEANAKKQQVIVTSELFEKVREEFEATALEPMKVKGKESLQQWWLINERRSGSSTS